ncbi:fibronectin type III domain-containing protein [Streptomyces tendae]|uniref:fibronectin type III domain-containing protein n=1 Tax=Streptomyces tendae TaxID=1932 RepID=UPI0036940C03
MPPEGRAAQAVSDARRTGKRVELASERTETSRTWVNADGSFTTELSSGPVRFRKNGKWLNVDVRLRRSADGMVRPAAHPEGLRLSGGSGRRPKSLTAAQQASAQDLVTLGEGDQQITLQWRGGLPEPEIDGTRATYVDAVPGADVVVDATRTGFEQYVVVKTRPDSGAYSYTLPLKAKGLKVRQLADGSVEFTDEKNKKRAVMPAPVMWDATVDERSGKHTHKARVGLEVVQKGSSVDLVVTPDAGFLADPDTAYPVTVDPSTSSLSSIFDTYVQRGETVDWSSDTELDIGNPGTKNSDGTYRTARSFITWNTAPIADALVSKATLSLWNFHSANTDCSAQPWEVWTANNASTSSRWTNQPAMGAKYATSTSTRGNPDCTADGWITADVTALAQYWAGKQWDHAGMGLRASDEDVVAQWKRVNSANAASNPPKLVVNYNHRPLTGTKQEAGPPFLSYGGAWVVNTTTPTLRDTFTDPDGDDVDGTFQIYDAATNTQVGDVLVSPYVTSGSPASVQVPTGLLANGRTYKFRTNPYDGTHYNTAWSDWATFTVDTTAPAPPSKITSVDYPSGTWTRNTDQDTAFTFTPPSSDQNWIEWSLDDRAWTRTATNGATADVSVPIPVLSDGSHTIRARTVDKAENRSAETTYTFGVGSATVTSPADASTSDGSPVPLHADAAPGLTEVRYQYRGDDETFTDIPATDVTKDGTALTAWPVATTSDGAGPDLTWNISDSLTADGTYRIRAVFSDPSGARLVSAPVVVTLERDTGPTAPATPTDLAVQPRDSSLRVTWAAPPSDGGSTITAYVVTVLQDGTVVGEPRTVPSDARSATLTELTNGTTYTVRVSARNSTGTGAPAVATATPKAATAPGPPTSVYTEPGTTGVTVTWQTPTDDGGADLVSTTVEVHAASDDSLVTAATVPMPTRTASLDGLNEGATYYAVVYATNSAGVDGTPATTAEFTLGTPSPAALVGIGAWKTSDPATDAPMICILWQINGNNQNIISGQIHFQLTAPDGSDPDSATDWAINYGPAGNHLEGTDGQYAWCSAAAEIPRSTGDSVWAPVSFTGDDGNGHTISVDAATMKGMTIKDPDGIDTGPTFANP